MPSHGGAQPDPDHEHARHPDGIKDLAPITPVAFRGFPIRVLAHGANLSNVMGSGGAIRPVTQRYET